jgi:protein involved in polysaccharide export with SLBB domain
MSSVRKAGSLVLLANLAMVFAGCSNKTWDPAQIGRFRPKPAVNVILDSLGVAEEDPAAWEHAEEPKPDDIVAVKSDYTLRPGDLVRVTIFELVQEGVPLVNDYLVSETGKVSIPEVGVVQAAGLTETQLEEEIKQILSPSILKKPLVTVVLLNSQQRTFSILGNGVPSPSRYMIPRYDFRLTDALAMAGGPAQFNVSYIYVSRKEEPSAAPGEPKPGEPTLPELELIEPGASATRPEAPAAVSRSEGPAGAGRAREIPEPTEAAEPYELEREMLDMISPSAKKTWPPSEKIAPAKPERTLARPKKPPPDQVTATVVPRGFRLLVPPQRRAERRTSPPAPSPQLGPLSVVQTPSVLGGGQSRSGRAVPNAAEAGERVEWIFQDGKWVPVPIGPDDKAIREPAAPAARGEIEWVFRDGRWIPIEKGAPEPTQPPLPPKPALPPEEKLPMELEWEEAVKTRLLRIPADRLLAGDPRYNVVIKPGDTIHVPVNIIGEFCIMGNVNRSGFINLTGRPLTLKMAIAAAGGLGPLAWPKHCEVVRRLGERKEEIVMVDLDKIAMGEQPDFFIKPNDLINVGTHPTSRWRAVLRNAFRAAYGFAFVYDRNFADADYGKGFSF